MPTHGVLDRIDLNLKALASHKSHQVISQMCLPGTANRPIRNVTVSMVIFSW